MSVFLEVGARRQVAVRGSAPPRLARSGFLPLSLPPSRRVFVAGSVPTGLAAAQEEGAMQMNTS